MSQPDEEEGVDPWLTTTAEVTEELRQRGSNPGPIGAFNKPTRRPTDEVSPIPGFYVHCIEIYQLRTI